MLEIYVVSFVVTLIIHIFGWKYSEGKVTVRYFMFSIENSIIPFWNVITLVLIVYTTIHNYFCSPKFSDILDIKLF